jgi:hypothetical protein
MAARTKASQHADTRSEAIVLIGEPPRLQGTMTLHNRTDEKLKVKTLKLRLADGEDAEGRELALQLAARVPPNASARVLATLEVGDSFPPGEYRGNVEVGDETQQAVLHVLERRELRVLPQSFSIVAAAGTQVTRPIVFTNLGNVPATIPKFALISVGEPAAPLTLFHVAVSQKGGEGHQAVLDHYAGLLSRSEASPVQAVLRESGGQTLAPGETRQGEIQFELPKNLTRNRIYEGEFNIDTAVCFLRLQVENGGTDAASPKGRT